MRSSSSLLFGLVLFLSFALVVWWTTFLLLTSGEMAAASERLVAGDSNGVANALGAETPEGLAELGRRGDLRDLLSFPTRRSAPLSPK